jgi:16S rRNA (guanine527-N7)-methyltransferase
LAEAERYAAAVAELAPGGVPIVDLGSGAGLPGVVVAARLAPREVWWVERRRRRATFLTQVAAHAGLASVRVFEDDARRLTRPAGGIAAVTAQAVGTLAEVAALTLPLWGRGCPARQPQGARVADEVEALEAWLRGVGQAAGGPWADPRVLRSEPLGTRGTLVAVELLGG